MAVVVDAYPVGSRVVGPEDAAYAADLGTAEQRRVLSLRGGLTEADVVGLLHRRHAGELHSTVDGVPQAIGAAALAARQPDVAGRAGPGLEAYVSLGGQAGGAGRRERRPTVRTGVEHAAAEGVEDRRIHPVGLDAGLGGQARAGRPGSAVVARDYDRRAVRRPDRAGAVGVDRDPATRRDAVRLGGRRLPGRPAVAGDAEPRAAVGVADPDHDLRLEPGEVQVRGAAERRVVVHPARVGEVAVHEAADV